MKSIAIIALAASVNAVRITEDASRDPLLTWAPTKPWSHPTDYFVPHFGEDHDVSDTKKSSKYAESALGHRWDGPPATPPTPPPMDYFVPNFGEDQDIRNVKAAVAQQEALHGKWAPVQDDNGFWVVPGPADNHSYTYGKK